MEMLHWALFKPQVSFKIPIVPLNKIIDMGTQSGMMQLHLVFFIKYLKKATNDVYVALCHLILDELLVVCLYAK